MIGVMPGNIVVDRRFPSALYGEAKVLSVCFIVQPVGEPDAGNPHVRFDERGWETGRLRCRYRAHPRLYPQTPQQPSSELTLVRSLSSPLATH